MQSHGTVVEHVVPHDSEVMGSTPALFLALIISSIAFNIKCDNICPYFAKTDIMLMAFLAKETK